MSSATNAVDSGESALNTHRSDSWLRSHKKGRRCSDDRTYSSDEGDEVDDEEEGEKITIMERDNIGRRFYRVVSAAR